MAERMELESPAGESAGVGKGVTRGSTWTLEPFKAAFLFGVPLFGVLYVAAMYSPLGGETLKRYLSHPIEMVELALFCLGLGAYTSWFFKCTTCNISTQSVFCSRCRTTSCFT